MSNTQKTKKKGNRFKHITSFVAIHLGILLLMETDIAMTSASLLESGGGVLLKPMATATNGAVSTESVIKAADSLHGAAEEGLQTIIASQLVTGVLLVTLGFFLHVLWVSHKASGERPVRVSVKKTKKKESAWYWMELRV